MPKDLHELPKLRDSISHLYIEHKIIEQDGKSIVAVDSQGRMPIPVASLTVLMIGPGCSITHSAIKALSDNGCMAIWCGEGIGRFYAMGLGETRSAERLILQARLWVNAEMHMAVVRRMYTRRFAENVPDDLTLQQIRGMEGIRVRETYRKASKETGIEWKGRNYDKGDWNDADPINRALSSANACLYGICHAAIVSLGYSPGLGFIHSGKQLSLVYDIADLYKTEMTIPLAFQIVAQNSNNVEKSVRKACLETFHKASLLTRIPKDLAWIFDVEKEPSDDNMDNAGMLWDVQNVTVHGGINYGS
jgi:CRISP-associated protein Cas1